METIEEFLKLQRPKVKNNVEIITPEDLGQNFFLHIDIKTPPVFFPMVSKRAMHGEDNNVPRITVCDNIVDCIRGYCAVYDNFINNKAFSYEINILYFEKALKPNNKLVPDADYTNEYWLVTYNKETSKYKPLTTGGFFIKDLVLTANVGENINRKLASGTIYLHHNYDENIKLDREISIPKGYYEVKFDFLKDEVTSYISIEKTQYKTLQRKYSDLAVESISPLYRKW